MKEPWPEDRRKELEKLRDLIWRIQMINAGSNALRNIGVAIELAECLTHFDLTTPRKSFLSFLEDQATGR